MRKTIKMRKPDKSIVRVYEEDVEHRKTLGWKIVKSRKSRKKGKAKGSGK